MDRNEIRVADIVKMKDSIPHSPSSSGRSTTSVSEAGNCYCWHTNSLKDKMRKLCLVPSSSLCPCAMESDSTRSFQPASLETQTTCTTIESSIRRRREYLAHVVPDKSKTHIANAALVAILAPLVVYSLFQANEDFLMIQTKANNQDFSRLHLSASSQSHDYPCNTAAAQAPYQQICTTTTRRQNADYLRQNIVRNDNQIAAQCFHGMATKALGNGDKPSSQDEQQLRSCEAVASHAEKISTNNEDGTILLSRLISTTSYLYELFQRAQSWPTFGPKVLMAEAASALSVAQAQNNREIIVLNSTSFNSELIQHRHPFPHIKLIEYYLSYCGVCLRFKPTYNELAREIYPWRNVIRLSAIDLGVSSNSPIAHSWSVDVVPTLRIHPPPSEQIAAQLSNQLTSLSSKLNSRDSQKSLFEEYNGTKLMVSSLDVIKYTNDAKRSDSSVADKVSLLKSDLLNYIERYVRDNSTRLPETWPNLRPVREQSLAELRENHPRQELFLIIEAAAQDDKSSTESNQASSSSSPSLGLRIMMELSSSASWQAVRYVRASENQRLVEDVIAYKKKEVNDRKRDGSGASNDQLDLLSGLMESKQTIDGNNQVQLVHIDFSHSPLWLRPSSKFPFITVITKSDLITVEQSTQLDQLQYQLNRSGDRSKRTINQIATDYGRSLSKRSLFGSDVLEASSSLKRTIDLMTLYINQSYTETKEDREFVGALAKLDTNPTSDDLKREVAETSEAIQRRIKTASADASKRSGSIGGNHNNSSASEMIINAGKTLIPLLTPTSNSPSISSSSSNDNLINDYNCQDDYGDKLKAIRYIFYQEVPRKHLNDINSTEKLEVLNTLLNLVSVIKTYFPLPDAASVQFIDGVQNYLLGQQQILLSIIQNSPNSNAPGGFDTKALKQELRRLESEGKHLPQIKEWKHCKLGGYPCGLWRLFHTLTAFEYKKLNQINQLSTGLSQQGKQLPSQTSQENQSALIQVNQHSDQQPTAASLSSQNHGQEEQVNSPVERLVSPPSTSTSYSLTIATPTSSQHVLASNNSSAKRQHELDLLPQPVLLVLRDYVIHFFSCEDCVIRYKEEAADLTLDKIRHQEPAEFSVLWLWETHNRVSKRLSIDPESNPPERPKKWFPSYNRCPKCYKKLPSYLKATNLSLDAIFLESIEWNKEEVLNHLISEYTRQPMDNLTNIFGYHVPYGILVITTCFLVLIILARCTSCYIARQRRYKAILLNSNGYSMELQRDC